MKLKLIIQKQHNITQKWSKLKTIKTDRRNIILTKKLVGKRLKIHNGQRYFDININENMLGHKLGEFAPTRLKKPKKK